MQITLLKSKIHRATITGTDLNYEGSIAIDSELLKAAGIVPYELVAVLNLNTGERLETYAIEDKPGSGSVRLNGPAARLGHTGDPVIILSYAIFSAEEGRKFKPTIIKVDRDNKIT